MNPLQVIVRDLFGSVIFHQIFPNLPLATTSISLFVRLWNGPVSQVLLIFPKRDGEFDKTVFRIRESEEGQLFMVSTSGETVILPELPDNLVLDEDGNIEDPDLFDEDEDDELLPPF